MTTRATMAGGLANDVKGLAQLRAQATHDPKAAVQQAAKQFEALFMREMLKSMRAATPSSGLLDNQATRLGTDMLDGQLADQMSGAPGSLASIIARQLDRQIGAGTIVPRTPQTTIDLVGRADSPARIPDQRAADFLNKHRQAAQAAQGVTGIPATFMLAQAAHESGWGRREILHADGSPSNNLFGIKAGASWNGPVAEVTTTEYVDGVPRKMVQKFRAYASATESFSDYARLMRSQPRYQAVLAAGHDARGFAQGLQQAGYATDPHYADKLVRVIDTTMRLQHVKG